MNKNIKQMHIKDNVVLQKDILISNKLSLTPFESSISDSEDIFTTECHACKNEVRDHDIHDIKETEKRPICGYCREQ